MNRTSHAGWLSFDMVLPRSLKEQTNDHCQCELKDPQEHHRGWRIGQFEINDRSAPAS